MRIPDPRPLGDTSLRAIVRAIFSAEPEKVCGGGCVESVVTRRTHLLERFFVMDGPDYTSINTRADS